MFILYFYQHIYTCVHERYDLVHKWYKFALMWYYFVSRVRLMK